MNTLRSETTVGELVKDRVARARIFEQLNIDYCCGGKLPLAEACAKRGLDPQSVIRRIQESDAQSDPRDVELIDAAALGLVELADHIVETHHAYLRVELPRLDQMTEKVRQVHGDADPRLAEVRRVFMALHQELSSHMVKEERILFPMIRQLVTSTGLPVFHCGSISNPIHQMEVEHQIVGDVLSTMRAATDGYQPPEWACNTYRAMLDGLSQLEWDLHQHIHKENNVLFPRAMELEASKSS